MELLTTPCYYWAVFARCCWDLGTGSCRTFRALEPVALHLSPFTLSFHGFLASGACLKAYTPYFTNTLNVRPFWLFQWEKA